MWLLSDPRVSPALHSIHPTYIVAYRLYLAIQWDLPPEEERNTFGAHSEERRGAMTPLSFYPSISVRTKHLVLTEDGKHLPWNFFGFHARHTQETVRAVRSRSISTGTCS